MCVLSEGLPSEVEGKPLGHSYSVGALHNAIGSTGRQLSVCPLTNPTTACCGRPWLLLANLAGWLAGWLANTAPTSICGCFILSRSPTELDGSACSGARSSRHRRRHLGHRTGNDSVSCGLPELEEPRHARLLAAAIWRRGRAGILISMLSGPHSAR